MRVGRVLSAGLSSQGYRKEPCLTVEWERAQQPAKQAIIPFSPSSPGRPEKPGIPWSPFGPLGPGIPGKPGSPGSP